MLNLKALLTIFLLYCASLFILKCSNEQSSVDPAIVIVILSLIFGVSVVKFSSCNKNTQTTQIDKVIVTSMFYSIAVFLVKYVNKQMNVNPLIVPAVVGLVLSVLLVKMCDSDPEKVVSKDNFHFELEPGQACRGGEYLHQGDSPQAKMCQQLDATNPGEASKWNCGNGYFGSPHLVSDFEYSHLSNDFWKNDAIC